MSAEGAKTSFRLTFIPAEGIFEKRSEFINNISDNFNAIMQTKSSPRIKKLSQHRAGFIWNLLVNNSDLASPSRWLHAGNVPSSAERLWKSRELYETTPTGDNGSQFLC